MTTKTDKVHTALHEQLLTHGILHSCVNCEEWNEERSVCDKFATLPPPDVIVYGCPEWNIEIPF